MLSGLRSRFAAAIIVLVVAALAGLGAYAIPTSRDAVDDAVDERLAAQAHQIAALAQAAFAAGDEAALASLARSLSVAGTGVTFSDPSGTALGAAGAADTTAAATGSPRSAVAPVRDAAGSLLGFARIEISDAGEAASDLSRSLQLAFAVAGVAAALAGVVISVALLHPLRRLRLAAQELAAQGRPPGVLGGPAEVRELGHSIRVLESTLRQRLNALDTDRQRLQQALAASGDVVLAVDGSGTVVYANPAAEARLARPSPIAGQPLLDVLPDHEVYDLVQSALAGEASAPKLVRREGHQLQATAKPVADGGDWSAVLVMHDVTALHDAEAARRDFVANISHELRTPLSSIAAAVETLESGVAPDDAARFHEIIHMESERMGRLVEDMLELARLESGLAEPQLRSIDPAQLARDAVERMAVQAEHAQLTLRVGELAAKGPIHADPDLASQALLNLVHNAIKFTPSAGGDVTISTRVEGAMLWLLVRDTGVGLSREEQSRVFERFYRLDDARLRGTGAGLGLALVRHIAERHGGEVMVQSEPNRGSTFGFSLPLAPAEPPSAPTATSDTPRNESTP